MVLIHFMFVFENTYNYVTIQLRVAVFKESPPWQGGEGEVLLCLIKTPPTSPCKGEDLNTCN